uniref:laccase n=1 Tax=Ananas comosus var. bracteatus TaxID=296719 RepID=A0A6V7P7R8_ANACO|nr:unnamed protein product [Ananas comosus var. bracteatus]
MMGVLKVSMMQVLGFVLLFGALASPTWAKVHHHTFVIEETNYTRLCRTKSILTVNGQFPGPTIYARNGDTVIVKVYNRASYNITLHWHGVDEPRNPWSDGPEYITQCPIQPGGNFTQRIDLTEEEGTLWWHAHSDWDRATLYGAIVIHPRAEPPSLSPSLTRRSPSFSIVDTVFSNSREWWIANVSQVLANLIQTGADAQISDAYTINGQPGDFYPCSRKDTFKVLVEYGKTYLLRVINAAINNELFFAVAGHKLTVVGTDASYTKPFTTDFIMITPGQTFDVLLEANNPAGADPSPPAASTWRRAPTLAQRTDRIHRGAAVARQQGAPGRRAADDRPADHHNGLGQPADVPRRHVLGPGKNRLAASLNNDSFQNPPIDILGAYYHSIAGDYGTDFPNRPPSYFNFTADMIPQNMVFTKRNTENHPMHLHGFSFYVVGRGFGNYDEKKDPLGYNLVDPAYENTLGVPRNGWAAIRFRAANPGVWFMHCHLDRHLTWGMDTAFIVKNGKGPQERLLPPPPDMPPC